MELLQLTNKTFTFQGGRYAYLRQGYNGPQGTERTVEVPIIWRLVRRAYRERKRVLEVGNVLGHYKTIQHPVVDKYEVADGVVNEDILHYEPEEPVDLVVSISTLEHLGENTQERPDGKAKVLVAVEKIKALLAPQGVLVATVPVGYNQELDWLLKDWAAGFDTQYYLKRVTQGNHWAQVEHEEAMRTEYGRPFPCGNAVVIGAWHG